MDNLYQQALSLYNQCDYEEAFDLLYMETDKKSLLLKSECKRQLTSQYTYLIKAAFDQREYAKARHLKETYLSKFGSNAIINAFQIPDDSLSAALKKEVPSNMQIKDLQKAAPKKRNDLHLYVLIGCMIIVFLSYAYWKMAN